MRLVVTDANIVIDLAAGGLLEDMFRLSTVEFCVPDVLYVEELAENFGSLPGLGLKVLPLSSEGVGYVEELRQSFKGPSTNDLFALALAQTLSCALLSGDGALRELAQKENVEIHGTIWLIEVLLEAQIVSIQVVEAAYEAMRRDGSRLPWEETRAQIRRWRRAE